MQSHHGPRKTGTSWSSSGNSLTDEPWRMDIMLTRVMVLLLMMLHHSWIHMFSSYCRPRLRPSMHARQGWKPDQIFNHSFCIQHLLAIDKHVISFPNDGLTTSAQQDDWNISKSRHGTGKITTPHDVNNRENVVYCWWRLKEILSNMFQKQVALLKQKLVCWNTK